MVTLYSVECLLTSLSTHCKCQYEDNALKVKERRRDKRWRRQVTLDPLMIHFVPFVPVDGEEVNRKQGYNLQGAIALECLWDTCVRRKRERGENKRPSWNTRKP